MKPRSQSNSPGKLLNARDLCHRVTNLIRAALKPSIRVTLELSPQTGLVRADSREINRVILKLILHARDAMPEGGDLLVSTANVDRETGSAIQPLVRIVVADNGAGMNSEDRAGIAIVDRIVRENGGEMNVRSAAGLGIISKYSCRASKKPICRAPPRCARPPELRQIRPAFSFHFRNRRVPSRDREGVGFKGADFGRRRTDVSRKPIKSDLARIDRLKDDEIDYSDIPPLDDSFFTRATVPWPRPNSN